MMGILSNPKEVDRSEAGLAGHDAGRGRLLLLLLAEQRKTNDLLAQLIAIQGKA